MFKRRLVAVASVALGVALVIGSPACSTKDANANIAANSGGSATKVGDGRHDCTELSACCAKIAESGTREECQKQARGRNDNQCNVVFPAFQMYCDPANAPKPEPKPKPGPKPVE